MEWHATLGFCNLPCLALGDEGELLPVKPASSYRPQGCTETVWVQDNAWVLTGARLEDSCGWRRPRSPSLRGSPDSSRGGHGEVNTPPPDASHRDGCAALNTEPGPGWSPPVAGEVHETKGCRSSVIGRGGPDGCAGSSLPLPCPRRAAPDPRGPLGVGKGVPLPMCCVSSCTAGISFSGMWPVPPSLQQRRQQNTDAAIAQRPPLAAAPTPRRHRPLPLRPASRPRPCAGSVCGAQRPVQRRRGLGGAAQREARRAWKKQKLDGRGGRRRWAELVTCDGMQGAWRAGDGVRLRTTSSSPAPLWEALCPPPKLTGE